MAASCRRPARRTPATAGMDTGSMALTLINEKADEVVAQLYSDYCRQGGS